ncbi:MAG TPA: Clp protease N-terminal domain-containing protein, partial [Candidatus Binatia bacterium]
MISKDLETTLNFALKEAKRRRHEYVSLEHLLYALLRDPDGKSAIIACGGDIEKLNKALEEFFDGQMEKLPAGLDRDPQQTLSFHRVLQRAVIHAQSAERKEVNGANLLIAMFREADSYAVYLLEEQGITRFDLVNYVSHGVSKVGGGED